MHSSCRVQPGGHREGVGGRECGNGDRPGPSRCRHRRLAHRIVLSTTLAPTAAVPLTLVTAFTGVVITGAAVLVADDMINGPET